MCDAGGSQQDGPYQDGDVGVYVFDALGECGHVVLLVVFLVSYSPHNR